MTLSWDGDQGRELRTLDDVEKLEMLSPVLQVADGKFRGMPIRGIILTDSGMDNPLRIDVPVPLNYAYELGKKLQSTKVQVVKHMPHRLT